MRHWFHVVYYALRSDPCSLSGSMRVTRVAKSVSAKKERQPKPRPEPNPLAVAAMEAAQKRLQQRRPVRPDFSAKRSKEVEALFLGGLCNGWSVSKSAWTAGIDTATAYNWRNASLATRDEETGILKDDFADRWAAAWESGVDLLEDEAHRRAYDGVEKPVYQGGVLVGTVTEYSDTLMGLVLRGKRPERYNTERHEHTGKDGGAIAHSMSIEFVDGPKGKKA